MKRGVLAVSVVILATAGCGSSDQRLARTDVAPLIALAQQIADEGPCAQKRDLAAVRARAIALVNRNAVPSDLQEPFLAGVNDLAGRTPTCVPPAPAAEQQAGNQRQDKHPREKAHGKQKHEGGD